MDDPVRQSLLDHIKSVADVCGKAADGDRTFSGRAFAQEVGLV